MWLPNNVVADVDAVARIHYVNVADTQKWNSYRQENELRLLTGWCWTAKNGKSFRQGFKRQTVCYRDAWYELVKKQDAPLIARLRVVRNVA